MKNLFIKDSDEIKISFFIAITSNNKLYVDINKENLEGIVKLMKVDYNVEEHSVIFKKPNFGDFVSMANSAFRASASGVSFNPLNDRYQKLVKLIKSWTLVDENDVKLDPNEDNIKSLNPIVAEIIYNQLELEMGTLL